MEQQATVQVVMLPSGATLVVDYRVDLGQVLLLGALVLLLSLMVGDLIYRAIRRVV